MAAGAKAATYDERNRLQSDGTDSYTYTPRGTLSSKSGSPVTFDGFDRLKQQGAATYTYDALGRVATRNGAQFTYSGATNELATDGTTTFGRGPWGELLSTDQGLAISDQHGDVVASLPTTGSAVSDSTAYDPWGKVTDGTERKIGYQGDYTDPDTDQVNMTARWYDPGTGSFSSRDSAALPVTPSPVTNRYGYTGGSPLNYVDPDGHARTQPGGGIGSGLCPLPPEVRVLTGSCLQTGNGQAPGVGDGVITGSGGSSFEGPSPNGPPKGAPGGSGVNPPDPSKRARESNRDAAMNNPMPIPPAMLAPLYSDSVAPPVSSAPDIPSNQADDYRDPVDDVNESYQDLENSVTPDHRTLLGPVKDTLAAPPEVRPINYRQDTPYGCVALSGDSYHCPKTGWGTQEPGIDPHTAMGLGGMAPGVGALWDIADAITYAGEGDWSGFFDSLLFAIPGAGDAAKAARMLEEGTDLYRGMKVDPTDGRPLVQDSKRGLGAKIDEPNPDIHVDKNGMVHPNTGGMSVSPDSLQNLPSHRRPKTHGGTSPDTGWCMNSCDLPPGLKYRPDPSNPKKHGFIEPARSMPLSEYQRLLRSTRHLWEVVPPSYGTPPPPGGGVA